MVAFYASRGIRVGRERRWQNISSRLLLLRIRFHDRYMARRHLRLQSVGRPHNTYPARRRFGYSMARQRRESLPVQPGQECAVCAAWIVSHAEAKHEDAERLLVESLVSAAVWSQLAGIGQLYRNSNAPRMGPVSHQSRCVPRVRI